MLFFLPSFHIPSHTYNYRGSLSLSLSEKRAFELHVCFVPQKIGSYQRLWQHYNLQWFINIRHSLHNGNRSSTQPLSCFTWRRFCVQLVALICVVSEVKWFHNPQCVCLIFVLVTFSHRLRHRELYKNLTRNCHCFWAFAIFSRSRDPRT